MYQKDDGQGQNDAQNHDLWENDADLLESSPNFSAGCPGIAPPLNAKNQERYHDSQKDN